MNLTIIIPVFNSREFILDTLYSITSTIQECEGGAIIVDDGSGDQTIKLIKKYKKENKIALKIIKLKKNNGAGYAKNYGILLARTKYVLVCDSDNLYNYKSIILIKILKQLILKADIIFIIIIKKK